MNPKHPPKDDERPGSKAIVARVKNNLVALGSAAVFTVYAAGYERTQAAAARLGSDSDDWRPPVPAVRPSPERPAAAAPDSAAAPQRDSTRRGVENTPKPTKAEAKSTEAETVKSASAPVPEPAAVAAVAAIAAPSAPATAVVTAPVTALVQAPAAPPPPPPASSDSASKPAAATDSAKERSGYKDGTYTGWGTSRHGDIQATVMIKNGKIFFAGISECLTQYSCSWISALPPQVVSRQSAEVDYVSGATQSTRAFYYAVIEALSKAK